jgi:hypothetical protein
MKYSMTCPNFLINVCAKPIPSDEISGVRKRRTASTKKDVFCDENVSVDIQKIRHIHRITGSQYLMEFRWKATLAFIG